MESEKNFRIDICVECKVRDGDSSKKKVFKCGLCERWFCQKHIEPRLAFIRDYDAMTRFPEIRVLLDSEWNREDGHPDFVYSRKKFEEIEMEEKKRNELIKQALDRMNRYYAEAEDSELEIPEKPIDTEADRKKRVEILLREERELKEHQKEDVKFPKEETVKTRYGFPVSREVYSNPEYREYLDHADNKKSVEVIVDEYYRKYGTQKTAREETTRKRFHFNAKGIGVSLVVLLAGLLLFLYSSRDVYLIFIIPFIPFPIPFWVIGIALMIFGFIGVLASLSNDSQIETQKSHPKGGKRKFAIIGVVVICIFLTFLLPFYYFFIINKDNGLTFSNLPLEEDFHISKGFLQAGSKEYYFNVTLATEFVVDIARARLYKAVGGVDLAVLDGTYLCSGVAPSASRTSMNVLVVGRDAVAVEAVGYALVGLDPEKIPVIKEAMKRGFGESRMDKIQVLGESFESAKEKITQLLKASKKKTVKPKTEKKAN